MSSDLWKYLYEQGCINNDTLGMVDESRDCAWCLEEAGQPMGNGSHGICPPHSAQIKKARKEKRERGLSVL